MKKENRDKLIGNITDSSSALRNTRLFASQVKRIEYETLTNSQKSLHTRFKAMSVLADYAFFSEPLSIQPGEPDLFVKHLRGQEYAVKTKTRPGFWKNLTSKDIYVCCPGSEEHVWYFYPHDILMVSAQKQSEFMETESWKKDGCYHFSEPIPLWVVELLQPYCLDV